MTTPRDRSAAATDGVRIRGVASVEEVAAVMAVVTRRVEPDREDALQRWRRLRQAVSAP
ncbi:hypothetical protein [uncultured Jatrophihabitans sp.]|uniref:hypothetical protein n=1 Tax=uncultured Jatrophihabitans sp. TaxID=1610747 RepID=UPI0035CAFD16